jgi:hypothetical protein
MIHTAKLLEAPRNRDGVRVAKAAIQPGGQTIYARIMPTAGGVYLPYSRGNRVIVAVAHGDPDAGAYVIGRFTTPPSARGVGNFEFHAPSGYEIVIRAASGDVVVASESERVLLGAEEADPDYSRLACFDGDQGLDARLKSLQQQIDGLVAMLNSSPSGVAPGPGSPTGAWTTAMQVYATPTHEPNPADPTHEPANENEEVAARNVYARPDDPV